MEINGKKLDVDHLTENMKVDFHKMHNGIPLTDEEVIILKNNGFNVGKYTSVDELIFDLENYLDDDEDNAELEFVLSEISEFNYYHNAKK